MKEMKVIRLEWLTEEQLSTLRRESRKQKRGESERIRNMTGCDLIERFHADLSSFRARESIFEDSEEIEWPLPPCAEGEVGKFEDANAIALLVYAGGNAGKALHAEFSRLPSKASEQRIRQSAKSRKLVLHFFRLYGGSVVVKVRPLLTPAEFDADFLKSSNVRW